MSIVTLVALLVSAGAQCRVVADTSISTSFRSLKQVSTTSGLPRTVTLVPQRPIGSPWLYSPNVTAVNAYICPESSVIESLVIVNGSGNHNSPAYDGVPNWPSTIAAVQANCSGGIVLPGFSYNSSRSACKNLGYASSDTFTNHSRTYTGSDLQNFAQNFTYREGRLIYQINGQGSFNGSSGSGSCPSGEVLVGYSGIQICEGVDLLQFACANATSSRGSYDSSKPFNLTTPVSQQYIGRELPSGLNVASLGDQGNVSGPVSLPSPQGLPSGITLVPSQPIGSPWLFSPNITAARAYICQENTFLTSLTVLNGYGNTNSNQQNPPSTIAYLQGTCSDGSALPGYSYNFNSPVFQQYCASLGYPSGYTYNSKDYKSYDLYNFARRFDYRADRIFSQLNGQGGKNGLHKYSSCPPGQKVVGYSGLETCDGPDVIQFACATLGVSRGTFNSTLPIYMDTAVSQNYTQQPLPSGVSSQSLGNAGTLLAPGPSPASQRQGLPSGVTLVPSTTLTSLYLNSPNISAARAFICQGDAYLVSLNVLNGFGNTNSGKDAPSSISYIAGNCSDGTNLPDFSYDFNNPNFDTTCPRLGYPYGYTFLGRLYTYQDVALNLSSLAQRFTYRGDRILYQFNGQGANNGTLNTGSCPSGERFVGYAGLETCDGPSLIQFACAAPGVSMGAFDSLQPIYIDTKFSQQYIQKALPPGVNSSSLSSPASSSPAPAPPATPIAPTPAPLTAAGTQSPSPPAFSANPTTQSSTGGGVSGGGIAGIVVGAVVGLLATAAALFFFLHKKTIKDRNSNEVELYTGSSYLSGASTEKDYMAPNLLLLGQHSSDDLSHPDYSVVRYSEVESAGEAVSISSLDVPQNNPSSFRSLPTKWQIPLSSLEIVCWRGEPVELGRGGFGLVYRARVRKADAAVKVVKGGGEREQARLLHEIKVLEQCKSPHIVQFYGYVVATHGLLLCMEFLPGGTLSRAIQDSDEFQWNNRGKQVIKDIASGLFTLHEQNICHLDLKSPNVLLTSDRRGKIADFGLGKMLNGVPANTLSQIGTPPWTCPELLLHGRYSVKSDVWSLSTIIIEVCTSERANRAMSSRSILVPQQAPAELIPLIDACRADDPVDRPDIGEICHWLERIP